MTRRLFCLLGVVICRVLPASVHAWEDPAPFRIAAILADESALNEAHDIELQGDLAYVAGKGHCVAIIDIADPAQPRLVWSRQDAELLHDCETVLLGEGRLFLGSDDFHSIDVSDPREPVFDATIVARDKLQTINGMVRRDATLLAASKEGFLTALDVSTPAAPRLAGAIETRQRFAIGFPHDVDLSGAYAVVVDPNGFGPAPGTLATFRVFDDEGVPLPAAQWTLAGRVTSENLRGVNRVQVRGDFAYVGGSLNPRVSLGQPLAKGVVVNLSDPAQPREVAVVHFPDVRGPNGLTIAGDVWWLAGGQTIQAYDIRQPSAPRLLATFHSPEAFPTADDNAHDLVYRDGYLYVTSQGDHSLVILQVLDEEIVRQCASEVADLSMGGWGARGAGNRCELPPSGAAGDSAQDLTAPEFEILGSI